MLEVALIVLFNYITMVMFKSVITEIGGPYVIPH